MVRANLPRLFLALFAATQLAVTPAPAMAAPPEGKGKPGKIQKQGPVTAHDSGALITATITAEQARNLAVTHNYTGYGALPPGIRKNLGRGKPLPPGIAKKAVPSPLLAQLPDHPGYEWRICGTDLVLVAVATAIIADVLTGVFD